MFDDLQDWENNISNFIYRMANAHQDLFEMADLVCLCSHILSKHLTKSGKTSAWWHGIRFVSTKRKIECAEANNDTATNEIGYIWLHSFFFHEMKFSDE